METLRAPGTFFARLAEIDPAARIMPTSRMTLVQRGPFSSSVSTDPMMMICTRPRTSAMAASLSRWMLRRRASRITASASTDAMAACANPNAICEWKNPLSTQHLRGCTEFDQPAGLNEGNAMAQAARLFPVVRDHHEGRATLADQAADQFLDPDFCILVQRRRGFVEQQDLGTIRQGAGKRNALLLAAGQVRNVARGEAWQSHVLQQAGDFAVGQSRSTLRRAEAQIGSDVPPGKRNGRWVTMPTRCRKVRGGICR